MAATEHGPIPFAADQVPDERRVRRIHETLAHYHQVRLYQKPIRNWVYLGLFYNDSTKPGVTMGRA